MQAAGWMYSHTDPDTGASVFINGSFYDTETDRDHDWRMSGNLIDDEPATATASNSYFVVYQSHGNLALFFLFIFTFFFGVGNYRADRVIRETRNDELVRLYDEMKKSMAEGRRAADDSTLNEVDGFSFAS